MNSVYILYPAFAMFLMTMIFYASLGIGRFMAVKKRKLDGRYYKLYKGDGEPDYLRVRSRHVSNHFEAPILFYIGVILIYITQQVSALLVGLAWAYVALRLLHSVIHLGYNKVIHRFLCFVVSLLVLDAMWVVLFLALLP